MRNMKMVVELLVLVAQANSPIIDLVEASVNPAKLVWSDANGETCTLEINQGSDARWDVTDPSTGGWGSRLDDAELDRWFGEHHVDPRSATTASDVAELMAPWCFA